ncbi:MAG: TauD/TfdA dioxygenase family protein [Novosphingobium sp.]
MASASMVLDVSPLAPGLPFGATISGLGLVDLDDIQVQSALRDLWIDKGVVLFRHGEESREMQLALSRIFGPLEQHMFAETHAEGEAELTKIKFYPDDGSYYEIDGDLRGSFLPWHSDLIYTHRINRGGILRPVELPQEAGRTGFIDRIAAYERVPAALRERIEDLHVVYEVEVDASITRFANPGRSVKLVRMATSGKGIETRKFTYPRVIHPMVYTQAETGRKVLNLSPWFALGIYEMGGRDGDELLEELVALSTDPTYAYMHEWRMGDMVLWDNWRTLHCFTGVPPHVTRVMERTTISGDYAMGRPLGLGGPEAIFDM